MWQDVWQHMFVERIHTTAFMLSITIGLVYMLITEMRDGAKK